MFWFFVLVFLFGLCVGSFLNVLIYRLPRGLPITGRSFCPKCKKKIVWSDNLPLLSFIFLGGRCRLCRSPIGIQYPLVELLTGFLFIAFLLFFPEQNFQFSVSPAKWDPALRDSFQFESIAILFFGWFLVSALVTIFFVDLRHQIIPDQIVYPAILVGFFLQITNYQPASPAGGLLITNYLITAIIAALFFFSLHLITRGRGMGFGDVKLAFLIGLVLGFPGAVLAFYLAFLTGALVGVILILIRVKKFGQTVPFGPFLVLGTMITLFAGQEILKWTNRFF